MAIKMESLVSMTAMLTAIVAVVIGVLQTNVMTSEIEMARQHQKLSVKPALWITQFMQEGSGGYKFGYHITNNGLGPALIQSFSLSYQDQPMANWQQLLVAISKNYRSDVNYAESEFASLRKVLPKGYILPAGKPFIPLSITNAPDAVRLLSQAKPDITMGLCYCSMYQDCWFNQGFDSEPQKVAACEANSISFDSGTFQPSRSQ